MHLPTLPTTTVLLRATGLVLLLWHLPNAWIAWHHWTELQRTRTLRAAGMITTKEVGQAWIDLLSSTWPLAAAAILFFAAPLLARVAARGLHPPGSCPRCGYDLRGCPPGPCPECGKPAPRQ
jgi:hypothetical protein